jgi:hypothetical protein
MRQLHTDIEIDATPDQVWAILTDFASYPAWNPFIESIRGEPVAGSKLEVGIAPPEGKAMTFKPTVLNAEPNRELRWLGRVLLPRILDGEHMLQLEPLAGGRVRFVQAERFRGVLVPLIAKALVKTERGFTAMNEALKRRAETP